MKQLLSFLNQAPEEKTGCNTIRESAKVEHRNEVQVSSDSFSMYYSTRSRLGFVGKSTGSPVGCVIRVCIGLRWYKVRTRWYKLTWSLVHSFLCVSAKFQPISASFAPARIWVVKKAIIGWNFAETQRKAKTRLQVSLSQFISCYSPQIRFLILYHRNHIQTLIRHLPVVKRDWK